MTYNTRYILRFNSEKYNYDYKILVKEKDYTGEAESKALGSAPVLRRDDSDSGISGTSLELVIQADVDGELTSLYTVDNKRFLVELYRNEALTWCGYVLPEKYSEPYIAIPYDVSVTASDGLGILKDIDFGLTGEKTLFDIIKYCCDQTSLPLDFEFVSSLLETGMNSSNVMHVQAKLDASIFSGKTCYEVLESCMTSLDSFITQSENRWLVAKYTDLDKKSLIYTNAGVKKSERLLDVGILGTTGNNFYPIGNLEKEILPAYKSTKLSHDYGKKPSFLANFDFSSELSNWEYTPTQHPTRVRHAYYDGGGFVRILGRSANGGTAEEPSYIRQVVNVEKTDKSLTFIISHAMGMGFPEGNGEFNVKIKLVGSTKTYYLTKSGWRTTEDSIVVSSQYQGQHIMDETDMTRVDSYTEFKILSNGFPETGNLTIQIENPVVTTDFRLYINKVIVTNDLPTGIDVDVNLNSNASTSYDTVEIAFGDTPVVANAKKLFSGILWSNNGFTQAWTNGNKTDSFLYTILKCLCSRIGFPRQQLSGTIQGENLQTFLLTRDKYSNLLFHVKESSLNLLTDEMDCTLEQFMPYSELSGETTESARTTGNSSEYRSSGENEVRVYQSGSGVPMRIKDLSPTELQPDSVIEVDRNNVPKSGKATLQKLLEFLLTTGDVWTKEELRVVEGYILYLGEKIKAGDSDLWEGNHFADYLNQAVKTDSDVRFNSLTSTEFESKIKGWIIDALGDAEFRKLILREGFKTADFIPGVLGSGTGMVGTEDFTTGKLTVRNYMEVMALAVAQVFWRGGRDVHSPSGMKVNKVEEYPDYWRCYMDTSEGQVNTCTIGAQMRCDNYGDNKKKYYWNLVTGVGEDYIDLSKTDRDGVDIPEVGDELAQFGHRTDPNLSWILVISSIMEDAGMTMYAGVNGYTLSKKWAIRVGKDPDGDNRIGVFTKNGEMSDVIEGLEGKVQDATDKIDNLQIGGTNLLNGTDYTINKESWDALPTVQEENGIKFVRYGYNWGFKQIVEGLKNGKEYTISGLFRASVAGVDARFSFSDVQNVYINGITSDWERRSITFTYTGNNVSQLMYILKRDNSGDTIDFANLQIEEGNKATAWKYSQEDQESIAKEQGLIGGQEAVDGLQIGGTNLIDQFNADGTIAWFPSDSTAKVSVNNGIIRGEYVGIADAHYPRVCNKSVRKIVLDLESEYTVSFKIRSNKKAKVGYSISDGNSSNRVMPQVNTPELSENFIEVKNTFKPLKQITPSNIFYIYITLDFGVGKTAWIEVKDVKIEKGNKATDFSYSQSDNEVLAQAIAKAEAELAETKANAYADGIVTEAEQNAINEAEAKAIASNINILNAEKADIDNAYTPLYNSPYLLSGTTAANNLFNAKTTYNTAHAALISEINKAIADGKATTAEKASVDNKFRDYNLALGTYKKRVEEANKAIQDRIKELAEQDATNKVDGIQIGVRNLFLDSGKEVTNNVYNIKNYYTSIDLVTGGKYTLVLRGTTTGGQQLGVWANSGNGKIVLLKANMNDEVVFAHVTLPTINESYKRKIGFYNYPSSGAIANPATIKWACLYEGHIKPPMDWVQAPEDMEQAIQGVQDDIDAANAMLADIANDNKLTPSEKQETKKEWDIIVSEKATIVAQAATYSVSSAAYTNAYNALNTYITPLLANLTVTSDIVGTTFRSKFKAYYDAKINLLKAVTDAAKQFTQDEVSNIQVGGTNLFPISKLNPVSYRTSSSKEGSGPEIVFKCNTPSAWAILPVSIPIPLVPANTNFIISMDIRNTNGFGFEVTATSSTPTIPGMGLVKFENTTNEWKRIVRKLNSGNNTNIGGINLWGVGDVRHIKIEIGNKATDWSPAPEDVDQAIQDAIAKTVDVSAPSQVFKYGPGYAGTPTPASILLTASPRNFTPTSYQWQYLNGSTWTNISGATGSTYSVAPGNTTFFPSGTNVRTFRCICNGDEKLSDSFTIAKLADGATGATGAAGKDAYTVLLGNESHAFAGSTAAALAGSTTCGVTAYKGATQVVATIGTITGLPAGMTASVASNGTTAPVITFTVTTSMKTASGTVKIPVTVDGKVFTKVFSYSIAFKGATGATGAQGKPGGSINGKMLYKDPEFKLGLNGTRTYNAQNNGGVVEIHRVRKSTGQTASNSFDSDTALHIKNELVGSPYADSEWCLYIKAYGGTTTSHLGGFYFGHNSRANAVFVVEVSAKIPVGYTLRNIHNAHGDGYKQEALTPMTGTEKFERYIFKETCGPTGTFSTINFLCLSGPVKPSGDPLEWFVDFATVYDQTADGYADVEITTKDSLAVQLGFTNFEALKANALTKGPLIKAGLINADVIDVNTLAGNIVFAEKLLANDAFIGSIKSNMLAVGGFAIQDYKIIGGKDFGVGPGVKITSTDAEKSFKAYKDASHYVEMFYRSASDWGLKGVDGNPVFQLGSTNKIGPFAFNVSELTAKSVISESPSYNQELILKDSGVHFKKAIGSIYAKEAYIGTAANMTGYGAHTMLAIQGGDIWHQGSVREDGGRLGRFYTLDIEMRGVLNIRNGASVVFSDGSYEKAVPVAWAYTNNGTIPTSGKRLVYVYNNNGSDNPCYLSTSGANDGQVITIINTNTSHRLNIKDTAKGNHWILEGCCGTFRYLSGYGKWYPERFSW